MKETGLAASWLSVEQIRKQQRMCRETVVAAMLSRELPYEQRGRIRYASLRSSWPGSGTRPPTNYHKLWTETGGRSAPGGVGEQTGPTL